MKIRTKKGDPLPMKRGTYIFISIFMVLFTIFIISLWLNTREITGRAKESNKELVSILSEFRSHPNTITIVDSISKANLVSVNDSELVSHNKIQHILIQQSVDKITEYSKNLAESYSMSINLLILWGTLLTLLAVIFTFFGYLHIRDKLEAIKTLKNNMENFSSKMTERLKEEQEKNEKMLTLITRRGKFNLLKINDAKNELETTQDKLKEHIIISKLTDRTLEYKYSILKEINSYLSNPDVAKNFLISLIRNIDGDHHLSTSNTDSEEIRSKKRAIKMEVKAICNFQLGNIYSDYNENEKAVSYYKKAIEYSPKSTDLENSNDFLKKKEIIATYHNNLGYTYIKENKLTNAVLELKIAIDLNPNYTTAYNNLGYSHNKEGNYSDAILNLQEAIKLNPNYARAYYNLAYSHHRGYGNEVKAFEYIDTAIGLDDKFIDAYILKSKIYLENENTEKAEAILLEGKKKISLEQCSLKQKIDKNIQKIDKQFTTLKEYVKNNEL